MAIATCRLTLTTKNRAVYRLLHAAVDQMKSYVKSRAIVAIWLKAGKVFEKHGRITSRSAARLTYISITVPHGYGSSQWGDVAGDSARHTCVPVLARRAASSSRDSSSIFSRRQFRSRGVSWQLTAAWEWSTSLIRPIRTCWRRH